MDRAQMIKRFPKRTDGQGRSGAPQHRLSPPGGARANEARRDAGDAAAPAALASAGSSTTSSPMQLANADTTAPAAPPPTRPTRRDGRYRDHHPRRRCLPGGGGGRGRCACYGRAAAAGDFLLIGPYLRHTLLPPGRGDFGGPFLATNYRLRDLFWPHITQPEESFYGINSKSTVIFAQKYCHLYFVSGSRPPNKRATS